VIGSLIGLTNLAASNFLDEIGANRFGRQGGYLITDPAQRIFIAATDKTRVMQPGPPVGINPVYDRYIDGHEGSGWRAVPVGGGAFVQPQGAIHGLADAVRAACG
jgi:hypothetical protein